MKNLIFITVVSLTLPHLALANSRLLHCPKPAEIVVSTKKETYGTFISWKAKTAGISYANDNAGSPGPLVLVTVRLLGQAVNCIYSAYVDPQISPITKLIQVSIANFGDIALPSHFANGTKISCPYGGGYCCDVDANNECEFYFDN